MTLRGSVGPIIDLLHEDVKRQTSVYLFFIGTIPKNPKIFGKIFAKKENICSFGLGGTGRLRGADVDGETAGGGPASSCSFRRGAGARLVSPLLCDLRLSSRFSRGLDRKPRTWQLSATAEGK